MTLTITVAASRAGVVAAAASVTVDVEDPEASFRWFGRAGIEGSPDA